MTTKVYNPTVDIPRLTLPAEFWQVNGNGQEEIEEPRSETGRYVSEEEYWARYYENPDFSYEWNNGILEVKPVPDLEKITMFGWFMITLRAYLDVNPVAKMLFQEMGFRLPMPHKTTVRKPDLFVVRNDNPVMIGNKDPSYQGIADLCVESLSDSTQSEIDRDTVEKKSEYEFVGVHEYYILDPGEHMAFYTRTPAGIYVPMSLGAEQIVRSTVLPGFQFRVSDLYYQPSLIRMATDPLYRGFVLPEYQAALAREEQAKAEAQEAKVQAQEAKTQAEKAETRAYKAETLAERRAAKLRALGITDDDL